VIADDEQVNKEEALRMLQQALSNCKMAGIEVKVTRLYQDGEVHTVLVLEGVEVQDGMLAPSTRRPVR